MTAAQLRILRTSGLVLVAAILAYLFWWHYVRSPWTRDGRVRAEVVRVAPEVAGRIVKLEVEDNQTVHKGDVLFEIDPTNYQLALAQAKAAVVARKADLDIANANSARRQKVGPTAVSAEELSSYLSTAQSASAAYDSAVAAADLAQANLDRTVVRSPVNGYATNLTLRIGDYANPGVSLLTLVDSDSYWIAGYFEETKLPYIHLNDEAHIELMGWNEEISGHVESFSRAIADTNSENNSEGLANVNPIFTWVRLAQRIPVRIHIDKVPDGVNLAAGQTCTVVITPARK